MSSVMAVAVAVSAPALQAARLLVARVAPVVAGKPRGDAAAGAGQCRVQHRLALDGFLSGPVLVTLGAGYPKATGSVAAMMADMAVFEIISRRYSGGCVRAEKGAWHD
ncbi:hypothetical protein IHE33_09510 [Mycetohabitans endofungorum]|uniref:hypothetical protein n=1 Tax=Mycetohabitans endofungorum TaxID=417203 RepID=UPI00324D1B56